jgi:signal transduction histidine kinase
VRPAKALRDTPRELRRRLDRLAGLPLRPATARFALLNHPQSDATALSLEKLGSIDPGWALQRLAPRGEPWPLGRIADRAWWTAETPALGKLWRHGVAASCAARKLAVESGGLEPEIAARLGLLHSFGLWGIAAVAPELLSDLLSITDPLRRADEERRAIGTDSSTLGRELAERWGAGPILAEAAWLHADLANNLQQCATAGSRIDLIQQAHAWAERTPWALSPPAIPDPNASDPRLRILVAEVQIRCGAGFVSDDATAHEERLTRAHASLLMRTEKLEGEVNARDRFLNAVRGHPAGEALEDWSATAARVWCDEPGVTAARVVSPDASASDPGDSRPPTRVLSLGASGAPAARLLLWLDPEGPALDVPEIVIDAWSAWAELIAHRGRLARRLETSVVVHRRHIAHDEAQRPSELLDALGEFAAGAGHELNNPLAVIVGRAQLLLGRAENPDVARSLRAILTQAQRAHRIIRDLMYVARPPAPRVRPCQPVEVVRASTRDLEAEADARGIRVHPEFTESSAWFVADPDAIRHTVDSLLRNALEATPKGGAIRLTAETSDDRFSFAVRDSGRGLDATASKRLFDPFYCGKQAGRGLGMGLPRVGRIVERAGGVLSWRSSAGHGSTFHVALPLQRMPQAASNVRG